MRTFVVSLILVLVPGMARSEEYVLLQNTTLTTPRPGDGFDPELTMDQRIRKMALDFNIDRRRNRTVRAEVSIFELKESFGISNDNQFSAESALQHFLTTKMKHDSYHDVFKEYSIFVIQANVFVQSEVVTDVRLRPEVATLSRHAFRREYGPRYIERVDSGGYIYLIYVFHTRKEEVRKKILSSLQAAYSEASGAASLQHYLQKNGVQSEYSMYNIQDGGNIAPFLDASLAQFRTYLERWIPSVVKFPTPVRFFTRRYHDAISDFPHRWVLGFGTTYGVSPGS